MIVEFSSITITRFNTFAGLPQHLWLMREQPGLVFIRGRNEHEPDLGANGAGKSSIFEAMCWCLYGQTTDGMKTNDVAPWEGGDPEVNVTLSLKDEKKCYVTRKGHKILIDNKETDQNGVEKLLGMSFEVFKHTVLFGQGQELFFDLSPKDKMEVLVSALNLDRWDARANVASVETKNLMADQAAIQNKVAAGETLLRDAEKSQQDAETKAAYWDEEHKTRKKDLKKRITDIENKLDTIYVNHDKAVLAADTAETELKDLEDNHDKLVDDKIKARSALDNAKALINAAKENAKRLGGDNCPTCGQSLSNSTNVAKVKAIAAKGVPKTLIETAELADKAVAYVREQILKLRDKRDVARQTLQVTAPEVARLKAQLAEVRDQHEERKEESNPFREQAREFAKKVRKLDADLNKLDDEAAALEPIINRTAYWVKGFKQVRLHQVEELLEELELATNALLPESGLHGWEVHYAIERETKKGTVVSGLTTTILSPNNKKPVKWGVWSGGEAHRLRLVGALALSEVLLAHAGVNTNLEVLDEPTRDLSVEGVHDLCEFLANRAKSLNKDIFLTGHNVIESAHFSDTITVVKDKHAVSSIKKPR